MKVKTKSTPANLDVETPAVVASRLRLSDLETTLGDQKARIATLRTAIAEIEREIEADAVARELDGKPSDARSADRRLGPLAKELSAAEGRERVLTAAISEQRERLDREIERARGKVLETAKAEIQALTAKGLGLLTGLVQILDEQGMILRELSKALGGQVPGGVRSAAIPRPQIGYQIHGVQRLDQLDAVVLKHLADAFSQRK